MSSSGSSSGVKQTLSIDVTVAVGGKYKSGAQYEASYSRNNAETFAQFNQRITDYNADAFEFMAIDLTNQLIKTF